MPSASWAEYSLKGLELWEGARGVGVPDPLARSSWEGMQPSATIPNHPSSRGSSAVCPDKTCLQGAAIRWLK